VACFELVKKRAAKSAKPSDAIPANHPYLKHILEAVPMLANRHNVYVKLYAGMGCGVYVKKTESGYDAFFMHIDAWGQYGPQCDDRDALKEFLGECTKIQ
jgi:hypothetical protein